MCNVLLFAFNLLRQILIACILNSLKIRRKICGSMTSNTQHTAPLRQQSWHKCHRSKLPLHLAYFVILFHSTIRFQRPHTKVEIEQYFYELRQVIGKFQGHQLEDLFFLIMLKRLQHVGRWYYNFTQVGGLSQARSEDSKIFKFIWLLGYGVGIGVTFWLLHGLLVDFLEFNVQTKMDMKQAIHFTMPSITLCNSNRVHCGNLHQLIQKCEKVRQKYYDIYLFYVAK